MAIYSVSVCLATPCPCFFLQVICKYITFFDTIMAISKHHRNAKCGALWGRACIARAARSATSNFVSKIFSVRTVNDAMN